MNSETYNPFNFDVPEKRQNSIWIKLTIIVLTGIFISIPLAEIDNSTFGYNNVYVDYFPSICPNIKCMLINH